MHKFIKSKKKNFMFLLVFTLILTSGIADPLSFFSMAAPEAPSQETSEENFPGTLPLEIDTSSAYHIRSTGDLMEFAKNCTTDTWSQNKVFVLDTDIDLSDDDFKSVPTFGGIFLGQNHTIKGFSLESGNNYNGFFRYIQEEGEVYGLSISGTAQSESTCSGLSLFVGRNAGLVSNCHVSGNVSGGDQAGGIAGLNEITGVISGCTSNGLVYGSHLSGGIAGNNKGAILNCTNHSFVNTTASDNDINLSSIDFNATLIDILTTENAASVTDIGGIAGSNSGIIRACVNDGSVGYQHVGYNIGGIAGSQSGYIEGCVNYGLLNGRKDVGGIVGQMEPSSELEFSEDMLEKLDVEFDKLHDLFTQLDRDTSHASSRLTGQISNLLDSVENAQNAVDQVVTDARSHMDEFSQLTDLTILPSPKPVSLDFLDQYKLSIPSVTPWPMPSIMPSATPTASETPSASPTVTPTGSPEATPTVTPTALPTPKPDDMDGSNDTNGNDTDNPPENDSDSDNSDANDNNGNPNENDSDADNSSDIKNSENTDNDSEKGNSENTNNVTTTGNSNNTATENTKSDKENTKSGTDTGNYGSKNKNAQNNDNDISLSRVEGSFTLKAMSAYPPFLPQALPLAETDTEATPTPTPIREDVPNATPTPIATPDATATPDVAVTPGATASPDGDAKPTPTIPSYFPFDWIYDYDWPIPSENINFDFLRDWISREQVENDLNNIQNNVYDDVSNVLEGIQDTIQDQAAITSSRILSAQNSLSSSFTAIINEMRILNTMLDDENQVVLNDFQAIIDEVNVITNLFTNPETTDLDDILNDVSDEDKLTDTAGKVMNCINNGNINGDLNVGGIAGTLSKENNLDPENDFDLDSSGATLNFRYKERIVLRQCQNYGTVEGKKNCIGGISGEMTLGSILSCTNEGSVTSDGNMIGGIAGYSASSIRGSSTKCSLSGNRQIGGIAGYGTNISDCYSMITIQNGENCLGSIAGEADSHADISGNFFVQGCPAGIDGISYEGKAQSLAYEEFMESPGLSDIFQNIHLTFLAEDKTISVVTLEYGDSFSAVNLPDVPAKEGYVGKWEDFNTNSITFDQTIEAIYTEYITTIESEQTVNDRPVVLIEGLFTSEDTFTLTAIDAYPKDAKTKAECWKISMPNTISGSYMIRYLIPTDMENPSMELYSDSIWHPIDANRDGSYYVFTLDSPNGTFCCVDRPTSFSTSTAIALIICIVLLFAIVLIIVHTKKKKRHK